MSTVRSSVGNWEATNESVQGVARVIQEAIAPEISVRSTFHNAVIPLSANPEGIIAAIELRPEGVLDKRNKEPQASPGGNEVARIAIKSSGRVLFVDAINIIAARAEGNYLALVHKSGCYLVRETMARAEKKLSPLGFLRIHRSKLVNSSLVKDLRRDRTGTYVLRTNDGSEHLVGRAYKDNLKAIASSWLGLDLV